MRHADVVIVGAGQGGAQAAIALRQQGFEGSVMIVGREAELPYTRPPLSKGYLAREESFERLLLSSRQAWADRNVTLILGESVVAVDSHTHCVELAGGEALRYGKLIWSAGGEPRKLNCPGSGLYGVFSLRTRADADALLAALDAGARRAVIVGGGFIGLEAAAQLRKLGVAVTLLETLPRVLARVAGPELAAFFAAEHRSHGVDLRTGVALESIQGENGRVVGARLGDGTMLPADLVIVGIGILPCVHPLRAAGAQGENGVDVDEFCRTSLADIHAIGDCAAHVNAFSHGARIRLESIQNANGMATVAARAICGTPLPYTATPWFWSGQYDLKLQTIGLSMGYDQSVVRGNPAARSFSLIYLRQERVVALDCVNAARDYTQGRRLVEARASIALQALADTTIALKELA